MSLELSPYLSLFFPSKITFYLIVTNRNIFFLKIFSKVHFELLNHETSRTLDGCNKVEIIYLSPTIEGKLHDKALAEEMELSFPADGVLMQDLGFLAFNPGREKIVMPKKKPKKKSLSKEDKAFNQLISSMRVTVEHAIGSVKRLRIVEQKIRLRIEDIQDQVMLIAVGLHNLRRTYRNLS